MNGFTLIVIGALLIACGCIGIESIIEYVIDNSDSDEYERQA